ncbi:hypothetical protein [Bradyrhizobium sp. CCBAU 53351]|uniref:hypothetical protein n=1 Tax=Bradyrhizobium sp. CCBAU 53351 TaxID=1325114 RepID=UPI0018880EE2|nr:hypothetical protein [Bradyrhizobium sp. CCBAU 53351]
MTDGVDPDTTAFEQAFITSLIEQTPMDSIAECLDGDTAATLARALNRRAARSARMSGRARVREVESQHQPWVGLQRRDDDPELDAILFGQSSLSDAGQRGHL